MKIIVDLFNQHSGDLVELKRLALSAYLNGADIVKTQIIDSKRIWGDESRKYLEMSFDQVQEFHDYCLTIGVEFMTTIFNEDHINWLDKLEIKRYKIASITSKGRTQDPKGDDILCKELLKRDKPVFISLGFTEQGKFPYQEYQNAIYFFCVPKYPTPLYDEDLKKMPAIFCTGKPCFEGFSDHVLGISAALLSYTRGAKYIEKHFTNDIYRQGSTEKAHLCSFTSESLAQFKNIISQLNILNG